MKEIWYFPLAIFVSVMELVFIFLVFDYYSLWYLIFFFLSSAIGISIFMYSKGNFIMGSILSIGRMMGFVSICLALNETTESLFNAVGAILNYIVIHVIFTIVAIYTDKWIKKRSD